MDEISPLMQSLLSAPLFLAFLLSATLIPFLRRLAINYDFTDLPGGRKQHKAPVPLVGGIAIFIACAISILVWGVPKNYDGVIVASTGIFIIGLIDDKYDLKASIRLILQTLLVVTALWWDSIWISQITITPDMIINLSYFSYPLTVIVVLGIMNAINMLDGLDGLSSGIVLFIVGFLVGISSISNESSSLLFAKIIFGAVFGFWLYNYRFAWREKASVFMGDSGTNLLGFILPCIAIKLSSIASNQVSQTTLLWLFAIPIWDIVAVIVKRVREGRSPLSAGRDHIHHVLLKSGLTVRQSLHLIYLLSIATVSFGLSLQFFKLSNLESYLTFTVFMVIYLGRVGSLYKKRDAEIYDFERLGDRRDEEDESVVNISTRRKTLS